MTRTPRAVFVGVLSVVLVSCGDSRSSPLAAPTPMPAAAPVALTFSVSGVISEVIATGLAPLAEAQVTAGGLTVSTNNQGFFSLLNLEVQPLSITASKAGYKSETRSVRFPPVNAYSALFNMEIVRDSDIHTLSGVVSERAPDGRVVTVQGAGLTVMSCNAVSQGCLYNVIQDVTTDSNGFYRFTGLYAGKNNFLWVTKDGYDVVDLPPTPTCDNCNAIVPLDGDTRFDIQLVRR